MRTCEVCSELKEIYPLLPFKKAGAIIFCLCFLMLTISSISMFDCNSVCPGFSLSSQQSALQVFLISLAVLFFYTSFLLFSILRLIIKKAKIGVSLSERDLDAFKPQAVDKLNPVNWMYASIISLLISKIPFLGLVGGLVAGCAVLGSFYALNSNQGIIGALIRAGMIGIVVAIDYLALFFLPKILKFNDSNLSMNIVLFAVVGIINLVVFFLVKNRK